MKLKTIDVQAKEWFDRYYGNSYFSAQVTVNYGMQTARVLYLPFQYGYGSQYEYAAMKALRVSGLVKNAADGQMLWTYCHDHGIIKRCNMQENCLKRDVREFGQEAS